MFKMELGPSENPLTEEEKRLFRLYGRPPHKTDLLHHQLKRRFFDSGDFALSQAHKASDVGAVQTGGDHPTSNNTSHLSAPVPSNSNVSSGADQQPHDRRGSDVGHNSHLRQESHGGATTAEILRAEGVGVSSGAAAALQHVQKK